MISGTSVTYIGHNLTSHQFLLEYLVSRHGFLSPMLVIYRRNGTYKFWNEDLIEKRKPLHGWHRIPDCRPLVTSPHLVCNAASHLANSVTNL